MADPLPNLPILPATDPVPVPPVVVSPDYRYALITGAITAVVTAILAFLPISGEQKAAVMGAAVACGSLFAYVFVSSHKAAVQASATVKAAHLTAVLSLRHPVP